MGVYIGGAEERRVVNDVVNALLQGRKTSVVNDAGIGVGSESWIALPRHPPPPHGLKRSLLPPGSRASPLSGGTCLGGVVVTRQGLSCSPGGCSVSGHEVRADHTDCGALLFVGA